MSNQPKGCDPCSYPECGCQYSENGPNCYGVRADAMSDEPKRELLPGEAEVDAWIDTLEQRADAMSDDIVERLREDARGPAFHGLSEEAADEIERLRAEKATIKQMAIPLSELIIAYQDADSSAIQDTLKRGRAALTSAALAHAALNLIRPAEG